ncbi:CehA/McbA family metallohydrolase [Paenibacillus residui]|uniref:CehA/McbA family metallohydrolase n=1 Tax=Paenibacillus residui TaxID=629724 RepID=A0ABW3D692_9BACL
MGSRFFSKGVAVILSVMLLAGSFPSGSAGAAPGSAENSNESSALDISQEGNGRGFSDIVAGNGEISVTEASYGADSRRVSETSAVPELPDSTTAVAGKTGGDPGFTYAVGARDWVEGKDYYFIENDQVKLTIGTDRLSTNDPVDTSDEATGNNKWGTLTPGHMMDAAPKFNMRDNLDYTEFVLSKNVGRTWWYPTEKLSMPNIQVADHTVVADGTWDSDPSVKAQVTYSIVENSPLIKMKVKLINEGTADFSGHLAYIIDPEEALEQQSYVPGWGWRGGQVSEYITSGWNNNYIFNGIQDKYTGHTAHAIIWPDDQQPSALIPEGYISGAWFKVTLPVRGTKELVIYHLPHNPGPAYEAYQTAEFWANVVKQGIDPAAIGQITGQVTDSEGRPSGGVEIELRTVEGGKYAAATTDSRGMYSLYAVKGEGYSLHATNGSENYEQQLAGWGDGNLIRVDFNMTAPVGEIVAGVTRGDPGFTYEGTSRDWWPKNDYYYIESPDIKFTVGTVRTAGKDPVDWSNDASGNNKWGSLTPGHIMDAVPKLTMQENLDFTEFVLSDDLGVTPEDEANGKHMEWSWFHPLTKLQLPDIRLDGNTIVADGDWDSNDEMKASVRYSIVEGTPLIKMEITLDNRTGSDFNGNFGYIIDPDQPGEQHSYLPGRNWVYSQEKNAIRSGWTDNYLFNGINNAFTGKTAHAILWPNEQQPEIIMHEAIFMGVWFPAVIPDGESQSYVIYHLPHVAGPADKPYAAAEFWAQFIRDHGQAEEYGSITGSVTDEAGAPVPFTEIVAADENGALYARAVTNREGKYQIFAKKGVYRITPVNEEYSVEGRIVEIGEIRRIQADFTMKKYAEVRVELPSELVAETPFEITMTVQNLTDAPLQNVALEVHPPYFVHLLDEGSLEIPVIDARAQAVRKVRAVALEGGRSVIQAKVSTDIFNLTGTSSFDVRRAGYYGGDNHSHTKHSDGVHTVAENSASVYNNRLLSWLWSSDHNTDSQGPDTDAVTESYNGRFLSLPAAEITTKSGHALAFGINGVPRYDINDPESGYSWQDSIDEVTGQGGLFYIAHPFDQTYTFRNPYQWTGFTGVEVWNGTWHALDNGVNERAFRFWDEINIRGDGKYYGIANSDGHTKDKVGDPYIKGKIGGLSKQNVLELLRNGGYYGSNGPELRFSIGGVDMGGTLQLESAGHMPFQLQAFDPNSNLTSVRVIKYPVTGDIADYARREIVFEEDLTGRQTNTFSKTIPLPVTDKEFYRMEVRSEKAQENSSGIGPLAGTGFAFSNPVWVELSGSSNSAAIESISYKNKTKYKLLPTFGVNRLEVYDNRFDPKKLSVITSSGAKETSIHYTELVSGTRSVGLLKISVTAKDGTRKDYSYVVDTISVRDKQNQGR